MRIKEYQIKTNVFNCEEEFEGHYNVRMVEDSNVTTIIETYPKEDDSVEPEQVKLEYQYDDRGLLTNYQYSELDENGWLDGSYCHIQYDSLGRPVEMIDNPNGIKERFTWSYDLDRHGNGTALKIVESAADDEPWGKLFEVSETYVENKLVSEVWECVNKEFETDTLSKTTYHYEISSEGLVETRIKSKQRKVTEDSWEELTKTVIESRGNRVITTCYDMKNGSWLPVHKTERERDNEVILNEKNYGYVNGHWTLETSRELESCKIQ